MATEAAGIIRDYAFAHLPVAHLICLVNPENEASRRVVQKIGMTLEKEMILDETPALVISMDSPGSSES